MDLPSPSRSISLTAILCLVASVIAVVGGEALSVYEALRQYDFPSGLIPKGATGYELNNATGDFKAFLSGTCSFSLEGSYDLKYKSRIKGKISKGKLVSLEGVSVKVFLLWLNIVEVRRNGDDLQFSVGIASANFGVENFEESPQCGCGFDCDDSESSEIKLNRFVYSS